MLTITRTDREHRTLITALTVAHDVYRADAERSVTVPSAVATFALMAADARTLADALEESV